MKKVIGTKRYNTESAQLQAVEGKQTLYRKKTGEFFLHIQEEPERLQPLTLAEANIWGHDHLSDDQYEKIFNTEGLNFSPIPKQNVSLYIEKPDVEKLDHIATKEKTTRSDVINRFIKDGLKKHS